MKKCFLSLLLFCLALITLLPAYAAFAEGTAPAAFSVASAIADLPTDPFTWETLATLAGATLATLLIVQLLKLPLDRIWKLPTRLVTYVIALLLLLLATAFTSGLTLPSALLTAVNAVIVALAAMGAYEVTFRKTEQKE